MIVANNITKKYGNLDVLKGVNLEIKKSEIVSIIGRSGAGKSTLLHILGTLDKSTSGDIFYNDINVAKFSNNQLSDFRNNSIGFIFQFHHLLPEFTALENILIPSFINKTNKKEAKEKALHLLEILELTHRMSHKPMQLSGGEQQRIAIARALINDPYVIFADEPSGNLDSQTAASLHQLLFDLRAKFNYTFVIVTHNNELATMSDRILIMEDGVIKN
ncbi:MAG: ABC transporter ATP-binding protein [Saprospiraceae bacterium]|nr:ABC transporter ATP-binding protein [Saprospiraceae bacterium]